MSSAPFFAQFYQLKIDHTNGAAVAVTQEKNSRGKISASFGKEQSLAQFASPNEMAQRSPLPGLFIPLLEPLGSC